MTNYKPTKASTVMAITVAMTVLAFTLSTLITACGSGSRGFSIEGRLLNMNQADFYVYSTDGAIQGIDTIHVQGGRFVYEKPMAQEGTVVIVFPNFTVMPVFVQPGASIDIDGNAAHLKDTEITGTDDNELFTEWRKNTSQLSPPELKKHAEQFIKNHPQTAPARWLLRQYFIVCPKPDYKKAKALLKDMLAATNNATPVAMMAAAMNTVGQLEMGDRLPDFTARDIDGNVVSASALRSGKCVVALWATWNYESMNMLRQIASKQKNENDSARLQNVVTICLDADVKVCRKSLKNNNAENLTTICDGNMLETPLLKTLGLNAVPDNIKLLNGKVTGRRIPVNQLLDR